MVCNESFGIFCNHRYSYECLVTNGSFNALHSTNGHTPSGEVACWKDFKSDGDYLAISMDSRVNVETGK